MYWLWDRVIIICSFSIKSSFSIWSTCPSIITLRRLSPNFSLTSNNSSLTIWITRSGLARISSKSAISSISLLYSSSILSRSKPVSLWRRISRIAWAWISVNPNWSIKPAFASSAVCDPRIKLIILSILSKAILKPSNMWARAWAFLRSNLVLLTTTSFWCSR